MASDLQGATGLEHDLTAEAKMAKLRELFADARRAHNCTANA
jgi:hypothetical protein